jgi:uncharacterized membrane protein YbhN (UPF0104 family)
LITAETPEDVHRPSGRRRWLAAAVVVVLLAAIAVHMSSARDDLAALGRISVGVLFLAVLVQFVSQLFFNAAMLLPLRPYAPQLGYWEFFMVRTGGTFAGSLVPVAGNIGVRLAYLRARGVSYAEFAWATLLSNVLALVAAAALAAVATIGLWLASGSLPARAWGLSAAVTILGIPALLGFELLPWLAGRPWFQRWRAVSAMSRFRASRRTMAAVFAHSLARHALNFVTFGLFYQALAGASTGFLAGGLVYALTTPVRMINVTPGNLGVNEWLVAIAGKAVHFDLTTGLLVALAFRVVVIAGQALGALVGAAWLGWGSAMGGAR